MNVAAINLDELKKFSGELNKLVHEGTGQPFLTGKKIKTIAVSKEQLAQGFDEAIRTIDDEIVNDLPDEIKEFYNTYFSEATEEEIAAAQAAQESAGEEGEEGEEGAGEEGTESTGAEPGTEPAAPAEKTKPKKEKKAKEPKEKKEKPKKEPKPPKEKKVVEKSVFGHKVGTQSAALDDLLAPGNEITIKELSEKTGRNEMGVKNHIKHLEDTRGLKFEKKDGGIVRLLK